MTVVAQTDGCQSAGVSVAGLSGWKGKAQAPAPGHYLLLRCAPIKAMRDAAIGGAIARIPAQEFLRIFGECQRTVRLVLIVGALVRTLHGEPPDELTACRRDFCAEIPRSGEAPPHKWGEKRCAVLLGEYAGETAGAVPTASLTAPRQTGKGSYSWMIRLGSPSNSAVGSTE